VASVEDWLAAAGTAVAAIGGAVLVLRRKLSRDNVEIVKDRLEADALPRLVETLREERDDAMAEIRRIRDQRTVDAEIIARLMSDKAHLEAEARRQRADYRRMVRELPPPIQRVLRDTGFADLGPPELGDQG
jgi:predicted  nucleic acid-binding Zn-ribbon protein